jgi:hypothetical protein
VDVGGFFICVSYLLLYLYASESRVRTGSYLAVSIDQVRNHVYEELELAGGLMLH